MSMQHPNFQCVICCLVTKPAFFHMQTAVQEMLQVRGVHDMAGAIEVTEQERKIIFQQ